MKNTDSNASSIFSGITFITGIICTVAAAVGMFWLSRIIPGIFQTLSENGFSFMSNAALFHILWVVFFISLLITGIKLLISAL